VRLEFTKMQGLGNDFVVLDGVRRSLELTSNLVRSLANRKRGIGCDQVLLLEPPTQPQADFRYRVFNADGQEVEQCGNGARCIARFIRQRRLSNKDVFTIQTLGGRMRLKLLDGHRVKACLPAPVFDPSAVPVCSQPEGLLHRFVTAGGDCLEGVALSLGNPHLVVFVDDLSATQVERLSQAVQQAHYFPQGVNVGFCQILQPDSVRLRVYERGVGETQACGSGACAAVVAGRQQGLLDDRVTVHLTGGTLTIEWPGDGVPVSMTGEAVRVYEGVWETEQVDG